MAPRSKLVRSFPCILVLVLGFSTFSLGCSDRCVDDRSYFRSEVQAKVLTPVCMGCHTANGEAAGTSLILEPNVRPDYLEVNRASLTDVAGLERDGRSILLIKTLGDDEHGGGAVLERNSEEYNILKEFVRRMERPRQCAGDQDDKEFGAGLELLTPVETLRKASLMLLGRLPSRWETEAVRHGGEEALEDALRAMMEGEPFVDRMVEVWNDILLTDRYLEGSNALGLVDYDRFGNLYWYEAESNSSIRTVLRNRTNTAIAREPLELIAHLLRESRPFTEVLTADYVMVNAYSAMSYGLPDATWPELEDPATLNSWPVRLDGIPHAGVLTTSAFLNRYPTTPTNRNRHRSWAFYKIFLATDLLQLADRPVDPTVSEVHNPTMNDPQCAVCHTIMDPVAGAFQNWNEDGILEPPEGGWFPEMRPPGFGRVDLPAESRAAGLSWLAGRAVREGRFGYAVVQHMLGAFTGLKLLDGHVVAGDPLLESAFEAQQTFVERTAREFVEGGHNIKDVVLRVLQSYYFRADGQVDAAARDLVQGGTAHLLTPEELHRKIEAVTGYPWTRSNGEQYLLGRYRMLYGGIDSNAVTERLRDPNGIIANIGLRMATEMACRSVARDFVLPAEQRRMLSRVEPSFQPLTDDGFDVPDIERAIRENIRDLHLRILGEDVSPNGAEVDATYRLFFDTWAEGKELLASGERSTNLPSSCRATSWNGIDLPPELDVIDDSNYTIRAWMSVVTYLLSDYRFFYE
jgi:hypothetical protein